ncbi:MAG: L-ribulose-5-phosphate 4-epimerase [Candidatus Izemoplasmataceae bacterium]
MLEQLKDQVYKANLMLVKQDLVIFTWGNVSEIDRKTNYVVIKPSGVSYEKMTKEDMVVVDLNGNVIEGNLKPSSDTLTHLELYKAFDNIQSVVHTHSKWATVFAQSKKEIPILGTTHADYFNQSIPLTRPLTNGEIESDYELNTGKVIVEHFKNNAINPVHCPGVLVNEHGPFTFGKNALEAVYHAKVLETVADMAFQTLLLREDSTLINDALLKKHFDRKHGKNKYYGQ